MVASGRGNERGLTGDACSKQSLIESIHRLHFAFTITFHYLFPQLTMGLALLIVVLKTVALGAAATTGSWDRRRASGAASSASTSSSAWSPAFPWSSSSAPTGRASRGSPAASSASRWPWKASSASFSSRPSSASFSTAKSASPSCPLVLGLHGLRRLVDLRLLHHRHRRLDAASRGLRPAAQRPV
jgi:hypothetical protein